MSSSPSPQRGPGRVVSAEDSRAFPLASLLSAQSASVVVTGRDPEEEALKTAQQIQAAYDQGHADGLKAATDDQTQARADVLATSARHLADAATRVAQNRAAILEQLVAESVDLVFGLAREVIEAELTLHAEPAREAVLRALEFAPPDKDLVVRVHPSTALAAEDFLSLVPATAISIVYDAGIEPTGAVVDAGACRIDAQLGPALERVHRALQAQLAAPEPVQ